MPRGLYFSKALFNGLIFGGAYNRRGLSKEGNLRLKIDLARLIVGSKYTIFALLITNPQGGLYLEGQFNGGFFTLPVWGAYIWRAGCKENHVYSLPFGQAEASIY